MLNKIVLALVRTGGSRFLMFLLLIIFLVLGFKFFISKSNKTEITHDVFLEKVEILGKMELSKFSIQNVINKKIIKDWFPDSKILFIAVGEAVGCIDLSKIKKSNIKFYDDSINILLPKPEICYIKINHQKSKVYDISGIYFREETKNLVEDIYKIAESEIKKDAISMGIFEQTEQNAKIILKPLFENISGKKVGLSF